MLALLLTSSGFLGMLFRPRSLLNPMDQMNSSLIPRYQLIEGSMLAASRAYGRSLSLETYAEDAIIEPLVPIPAVSPLHAASLVAEGFVRGRLSVIMPAYNEGHLIRTSIFRIRNQLRQITDDYEIIVVNDGSEDSTAEIVSSISDGHLVLVSHETNMGKGSAFRTGFKHVTGEYTMLTDSDSEIWARDLREFVDALRYGAADIAIASKRHQLSWVQAPADRRFLSLAFNILARVVTGIRVDDTQAGLKIVRSTLLYRILPTLSIKRYALDLEFLAVASFLGLEIKQLPVRVRLDAAVRPTRMLRTFVDVIGIGYRFRIRRWYQKTLGYTGDTYRPLIRL